MTSKALVAFFLGIALLFGFYMPLSIVLWKLAVTLPWKPLVAN